MSKSKLYSRGWEDLKDSEVYGRPDKKSDFQTITYEISKSSRYSHYKHAAHVGYIAHTKNLLFHKYPMKAYCLMTNRFDGYFGFPGGLIDDTDNSVVSGLNRELHEELAISSPELLITEGDHLETYVHEDKKLLLHFYGKLITLELLELIEKQSLLAQDYGKETLGIVRTPCYVLPDDERGLPIFLCNRFVGNAREELLKLMLKFKVYTESELNCIVNLAQCFHKKQPSIY